jgi:hypothetical protein
MNFQTKIASGIEDQRNPVSKKNLRKNMNGFENFKKEFEDDVVVDPQKEIHLNWKKLMFLNLKGKCTRPDLHNVQKERPQVQPEVLIQGPVQMENKFKIPINDPQ